MKWFSPRNARKRGVKKHMDLIETVGGRALNGCVRVQGAKNSVLPILAATLVTGGVCELHNCPEISDVDDALELLRCLGCGAEQTGARICVDTAEAAPAELPAALVKRMRGAVLFLGAMLTRFSCAALCHPGGCPLGERPIDLHLRGLRLMGAECQYDGDALRCTAENLRGCTLALPFPSVGATENLLLAALGCEGEVVICNAAREPEIADLIGFLRACGAEIVGEGTSVLRVRGKRPLHAARYRVMPDRMEAATYLAAAAATRGVLRLEDAQPEHLQAVLRVLHRCGCTIETQERALTLSCRTLTGAGPIVTAPYDGFPTDAQAPVMAAMATAAGDSTFEETVFPKRFYHVPALRAMGASITAVGRYALVRGVDRLHGAAVTATDLRGGAAMVIAALCADGESRIAATEHMERGYTAFAPVLRDCGADITAEGQ